jgi:hypothetical protein
MRSSAGVVLQGKTKNRAQHARYWSATEAISGGGGRSAWGGIYAAVEMIEARDGENEWGGGHFTPERKNRMRTLDIA